MTEDQLAFYKGQIERQILELEDRLNSQASQAIATDTNEMADEIDRASIEEARRLELNRIEHDKLHLRKLRGALKRISEGDFGYCESCGDEISSSGCRLVPSPASALNARAPRSSTIPTCIVASPDASLPAHCRAASVASRVGMQVTMRTPGCSPWRITATQQERDKFC